MMAWCAPRPTATRPRSGISIRPRVARRLQLSIRGSARLTWSLVLMIVIWAGIPDLGLAANDAPSPPQDSHPPVVETPAVAPPSAAPLTESLADQLPAALDGWVQPDRLAYSIQWVVTMTLLGLVPAVLLMTTSYIRISIVLSLLRQAFGAQLLPMQVTTALAMFCTGLVMWPTWTLVHERAVLPLLQGKAPSDWTLLWEEGSQPIREFMVRQIDVNGNGEDVHVFLRHLPAEQTYPSSYAQVPFAALLPAFVLSELKTAFLIGFQIYLPFLVIDLVVAAITTSMGMFMLPPAMVSLPLKLLLFVMADGWRLIVEMLLSSFQ